MLFQVVREYTKQMLYQTEDPDCIPNGEAIRSLQDAGCVVFLDNKPYKGPGNEKRKRSVKRC